MVELGVILKGDINEADGGINDSFYENNNDFELKITVVEYRGYNVITRDWILKREVK